ncbi:unnamed protein product [Rotaria socialis]|uniref:Uncharacterized protein n=1 Tax=Rotaria socialis TaxID=392032 RepID=A0A818GWK9_9BILA|nr:unnamed protein product [Rotaria socialis]CAF4541122.1 unnamed protein product [Rotaria socialis]
MTDEEEIRQLMIMYALNDGLAVTKLVHELPSLPSSTLPMPLITNELETISDDEFEFDYKQEPVNKWPINEISYDIDVHGKNEFVKLYDDIKIDDTPTYDILTGSHDRNDSLEMISDDDTDVISLPEIMRLHFPLNQNQVTDHTQSLDYSNDPNKGHARNDRQNDIEIISDDDEQQLTNNNKYQQHLSDKPLTRNQKKSRKKRAKRYRFEIIREIYREFTITQIKNVLIYMNIHYVNINVVGKLLFIGVRDEATRQDIEHKLDHHMFTEEHYQRIHKKTNPRKKQ